MQCVIDNYILMRNRLKKRKKCQGVPTTAWHNDFPPSSAAGFFLDLPITADPPLYGPSVRASGTDVRC
ncbi:hypothetical protein CEXT_132041 [Caerostris extrusa]|uniref:Uncharacterized protein n=1 Tax=Caerostris extrusa TaxID=172846 RepID=A0AAV4Y5K8_CAEEX|nr:hypothetical protein CEXT_132041 [Caerostris extrusa]